MNFFRIQQRRAFIIQELHNKTHVFIITGDEQPFMQPSYDGPFNVITMTDNTATVEKPGKTDVISIDRVRLAFINKYL